LSDGRFSAKKYDLGEKSHGTLSKKWSSAEIDRKSHLVDKSGVGAMTDAEMRVRSPKES